jgi:hypothetical protein
MCYEGHRGQMFRRTGPGSAERNLFTVSRRLTVIQPNCRVQFTPEDVAFLLKSLSRHGEQEASLARLLLDPDSLDQLLDHEAVLRGGAPAL